MNWSRQETQKNKVFYVVNNNLIARLGNQDYMSVKSTFSLLKPGQSESNESRYSNWQIYAPS